MALNEYTKKPRLVKNPERYMQKLAKRGKLQRVYKNQNVNAHQATPEEIGTSLKTYKKDPSIYGTSDDNLEATNDIQQGDYIVNNVKTPWQQYVTKEPTFNKKYRASEDENGVYIPKGEDMLASPSLRRGVHFKPKNWGGYEASVDKGGRMMQSTKDASDIYPIQQRDFDGTYAPRESRDYNKKYIKENHMTKQIIRLTEADLHRVIKESVKRVINEMGYQNTMNNSVYNPNTLVGKIGRKINPQKAMQYDNIKNAGNAMYNDAKNDEEENRSYNYPSATDPYVRPTEDDKARTALNNARMEKYKNQQR